MITKMIAFNKPTQYMKYQEYKNSQGEGNPKC